MSVRSVHGRPWPAGPRGFHLVHVHRGLETPAAGTFAGEELTATWPFCSDGEVFARRGGVWVDQGWTTRSGALTMDTPPFSSATPANLRSKMAGKLPVSPRRSCRVPQVPGRSGEVLRLGERWDCRWSRLHASSWLPSATRVHLLGAEQRLCRRLPSDTAGNVAATSSAMAGAAANNGWLSLSVIDFDTESMAVMAQGTRGSNWFTYAGAGTPTAGTFGGELDSDMAVRTSDSEVFKRTGGAWADQGYKAGGTLA